MMSTSNPFVGMPVELGARYVPPSLVSGASRSQSWYWPDTGWNAGDPGIGTISRYGVSKNAQTTVNGASSTIMGVANGTSFAQILTTNAADFKSYEFQNILNFRVRTTVGNDGSYNTDDFNVFRAVCRMAYGGVAPLNDNGHDFGFQVAKITGATGFVLKDATDGWHIQLVDGNVARLYIRGPNGLIQLNLTAAPFDTSKFHTYEMRFVGATKTQPALFYLLIDGQAITLPALSASWATGTNNPPQSLVGTSAGFRPRVVNFAGNANGLFVERLSMHAGPTLDSVM